MPCVSDYAVELLVPLALLPLCRLQIPVDLICPKYAQQLFLSV